MKSKKLFLPTVILLAATLLIVVYSVLTGIALKPTVTEGEFPFTITYELDGETFVIDEVYKVRYDGNGGYNDTKTRYYKGSIDGGEDNTLYTLRQNKENTSRIELATNLHPDYMMGDPEYEYFDEYEFAPRIYYYDADENEYHDEETLAEQGVKLISYEYPTPIENSFVFSHISNVNAEIVIPALLVGILAWIATLIFVKKDEGFVKQPIDVVSIVLNVIQAVVFLPYFVIVAILLDALGDSDSFVSLAFYFIPMLTMFGIAYSVALRRKGYKKIGLAVQFIGSFLFAFIYATALLFNL